MRATSFALIAPLLASVVGAAACGLENRAAPPRHAPAALLVENRSATDVVLYLADGHTPLRLGRVAALARAHLSVPAHAAMSGARLLVRSAGSLDVYLDDPLLPRAGGTAQLTLQPILAQSTLEMLSFAR